MRQIYLVLSEELLADDEWHTETCRAFDVKREAEQFMLALRELYRENKHYENTTRFFIKKVPFGRVE
jgi:hypothetical protein